MSGVRKLCLGLEKCYQNAQDCGREHQVPAFDKANVRLLGETFALCVRFVLVIVRLVSGGRWPVRMADVNAEYDLAGIRYQGIADGSDSDCAYTTDQKDKEEVAFL